MPIKDPEKRREYDRLRNQSPARKERDRLRNQTPERKAREKARAPGRRKYKTIKQKEYKAKIIDDFPLYGRCTSIRRRCATKGIPCNIDGTYLREIYESQGRVCAITELPFNRLYLPFTASVDRIIPNLGYVKGNIRIILSCVNSLKVDDSDDENLLATAKAILNGPLSDSFDSKIQFGTPAPLL